MTGSIRFTKGVPMQGKKQPEECRWGTILYT